MSAGPPLEYPLAVRTQGVQKTQLMHDFIAAYLRRHELFKDPDRYADTVVHFARFCTPPGTSDAGLCAAAMYMAWVLYLDDIFDGSIGEVRAGWWAGDDGDARSRQVHVECCFEEFDQRTRMESTRRSPDALRYVVRRLAALRIAPEGLRLTRRVSLRTAKEKPAGNDPAGFNRIGRNSIRFLPLRCGSRR